MIYEKCWERYRRAIRGGVDVAYRSNSGLSSGVGFRFRFGFEVRGRGVKPGNKNIGLKFGLQEDR